MAAEDTNENSTLLNDRQLLELLLAKFNAYENRFDSIERNMNARFEIINQRLLSLQVQTETLTSLVYQALLVAHAVKGDVRALREESAPRTDVILMNCKRNC